MSSAGRPPRPRAARSRRRRSRCRSDIADGLLARLAVPCVAPAPLAVLPQRDAIRIVALGLLGLVVPALAVLAGEGHSDPDVSAGHGRRAPRVVGSWMRRRADKNPAPARGGKEE